MSIIWYLCVAFVIKAASPRSLLASRSPPHLRYLAVVGGLLGRTVGIASADTGVSGASVRSRAVRPMVVQNPALSPSLRACCCWCHDVRCDETVSHARGHPSSLRAVSSNFPSSACSSPNGPPMLPSRVEHLRPAHRHEQRSHSIPRSATSLLPHKHHAQFLRPQRLTFHVATRSHATAPNKARVPAQAGELDGGFLPILRETASCWPHPSSRPGIRTRSHPKRRAPHGSSRR